MFQVSIRRSTNNNHADLEEASFRLNKHLTISKQRFPSSPVKREEGAILLDAV